MPVHRRKNTTPPTPDSTQEQTAPALPDQQSFQQYVRELARVGLRMVYLEGVHFSCSDLKTKLPGSLNFVKSLTPGPKVPLHQGWIAF
jgi:hypothetical protein